MSGTKTKCRYFNSWFYKCKDMCISLPPSEYCKEKFNDETCMKPHIKIGRYKDKCRYNKKCEYVHIESMQPKDVTEQTNELERKVK